LMAISAGVDLHVHTYFSSDGDHSPSEVLDMARQAGLRAIAIADHDVLDGWRIADRESSCYGVEVVPCVELTTFLAGRELHLLAYFIASDAPEVLGKLAEIRSHDEARARAVTLSLQQRGVDISYGEAQALTPNAVPKCSVIMRAAMTNGRNDHLPLFGEYRTGARSDQPYHNFFLDHMRPGGDLYVEPAMTFSTISAIEFVRAHLGVPILAHPGGSIARADGLELIDRLRKHGLCGLEVSSSYHTPDDEERLATYCDKYDLVSTAGSDFHGATVKPGIRLGEVRSNPYTIIEKLRVCSIVS